MTPLLLAAVAVALPARLGLINVGGEGQLYMGAWLASAGALLLPRWPGWLLLPLVAILGFAGGALWAAIPGVLRGLRLVNETISTLLLNYVAPLVVSYFIFGPWRSAESSAYPQSPAFAEAARLPSFFDTRVHAGLLVVAGGAPRLLAALEKTRWGVQMRAIGGNAEAAQRLGIPVAVWIVVALAIGGGMAGLAGMGEVMGIHGRLRQGLSPGYGFTGFLIAWLAGGRPLGILLMAFLFAIITSAGDTLQITQGVPYAVVNILLAHDPLHRAGPADQRAGADDHAAAAGHPGGRDPLGHLAALRHAGRDHRRARRDREPGPGGRPAHRRVGGVRGHRRHRERVVGAGGGRGRGSGLRNLLFGWLVVARRANQLASGLAMMFFGFGVSALVGRAPGSAPSSSACPSGGRRRWAICRG